VSVLQEIDVIPLNMPTTESPKLWIILSLSAATYRFSDPTPPELSLTVTSNSERPLTVFTLHSILWPKLALAQRGFIMTDLTTGAEVKQTSIQLQRKAFTRIRGSPDEKYYLTIHPNHPTTVATPFSRGGNARPQPKAVIEGGWVLDENGKEMKVRRSVYAQGVDGLEVGHRYRLDVVPEKLQGLWWRWGTKDEVLVDERNPDRMLFPEQSEQVALDFGPIDGIEFNVEE